MKQSENGKKVLCRYLGGSHLYGLNTPESDVDERGVFIHTNPMYVYGFYQSKNEASVTIEKDISMMEFIHFIRLATKGNTQVMECLYNDPLNFIEIDHNFNTLIIGNRDKFINSASLFNCLMGYSQGELKLANGIRTGRMGGKRKILLEKFGFSPKNFSHLLRLLFCGRFFFEHKMYPVKIRDYDKEVGNLCFEIKTCPENFMKEELNSLALEFEMKFKKAYDNRLFSIEPNFDYISSVIEMICRA